MAAQGRTLASRPVHQVGLPSPAHRWHQPAGWTAEPPARLQQALLASAGLAQPDLSRAGPFRPFLGWSHAVLRCAVLGRARRSGLLGLGPRLQDAVGLLGGDVAAAVLKLQV